MRVLHLLGAGEDDGGILSVLRNLQSVEPEHGTFHEVLVNEQYRETRQPALRYRRSRHLIAESPSHPRLLFGALRALPELHRSLKTGPVDVLHAHSRGALFLSVLAARLFKRPVLFSNHAYARRKGLYRWAARQSGVVTSVLTPNMARHYGFPEGSVELVSECCANRFFETPLRQAGNSAGGMGRRLRFVGLGNIVGWKRWDVLLEAVARLAPGELARAEFVHYGPVPQGAENERYRSGLMERCGRLGVGASFEFAGPSKVPVETILGAADWFVLPSTNEPCSVALIEALASGVPAIVSASGGNVDIVQAGRTGLLFEPDNPDALAEALRRALAAPAGGISPQAVRDSVLGRSASRVSADYVGIYRRMAGSVGKERFLG